MSDIEDFEEIKQEDSKQSQKNGNKEDQFKARKRPEEPRPPQKLFSPPNPQEREQKRLDYLSSKMEDEKQQLCRFWLRGLCMFSIQQCKYAHGIEDLVYVKSEEEVDLDQKPKDYNQKALWIEAKPSYLNVYDYQFEIKDKLQRIYTQEEIDTDRGIRKNIRDFYHKKAIYDFYKLLRKEHPNRDFTEQFIEREFNRVGFNKIGFKLKYQYILNSLQDVCFESKVTPQGQKKPIVVLLEYPENQNDIFYNQIVDLCKQYIQSEGFPIMESSIRKQHYSISKQTEPGLHQILQYIKKDNLKEYFDELEKNQDFIDKVTENLSQEEKQKAIEKIFSYDNEIEHLKERAMEIIHHNKKNIFSLDRLEQTIIKEFPQNVKALGSQSKFRNIFRSFLIKQKVNIIRTQTHDYCIKYDVNPKKGASNVYSCKCPLEDITFKTEQLNESVINKFSSMRIVVVDDEDSLNYANYTIPKFKHVGVDLEGALRKEGYVQLVQISIQVKPDFAQIFIFDIHSVQSVKEDKILEKNMINCIQNIMQDINIIKIFHDCRRDSLALHLFMKACPKNVFDTAAIHAFKLQVEKYQGLNTKEDKNILQLLKNLEELKQPGLNDILQIYNTSHGINLLKDSMHQKFQEMPAFYFLQRPIDPEFLEYSARDVEDLIEAYHVMIESIKQTCKQAFPKSNEQIIMQWVSKVSKSFSVDWKSNQ